MQLIFEERVEQAFRHLQPDDAKVIARVFDRLQAGLPEDFKQQFQTQKLAIPGEQVFVLRANPRLRILFRYSSDQTIIIEDIVSHKALERFVARHRS